MMHTALLALDVIMLNFTDRIQAVEMLMLNASLAVNWIESVHRTAAYTTADTLLVPLSIDVVEHSIAQIIELSNASILITVNTVHTQQMIGTMADEFEVSTLQITKTLNFQFNFFTTQMLSLLSEEARGSLAQLTKDSECSLDKSSVHVIKANDSLEVN